MFRTEGATNGSRNWIKAIVFGHRLATFVAVILAASTAFAQTGQNVVFPTGVKAPQCGVRLGVDTMWTEGIGYRPVTFTITPIKPTTADRRFTIEFSATPRWGGEPNLKVTTDVDLPAGASPASTTIAVPQYYPWQTTQARVWEDGRFLKELDTGPMYALAGAPNSSFGAHYPKIFLVSDSPTGWDSLSQVVSGIPGTVGPGGVRTIMQPNGGVITFPGGTFSSATIKPSPVSDLPRTWLELSSLDLVILSIKDLQSLAEDDKERFEALTRWTRAGGNLVVHGLDGEWAELRTLDGLLLSGEGNSLESSPQVEGPWSDVSLSHNQGIHIGSLEISTVDERNTAYWDSVWQAAQNTGTGSGTTHIEWAGNGSDLDAYSPGSRIADALQGTPLASLVKPKVKYLRTRSHQFGQIAAISEDPAQWSPERWVHFFAGLGQASFKWSARHGISFAEANNTFWDFLIEGVGLVPVNAFRIILTAFVLVIGPVNYYLLRVKHRLHLLVISVPACAFVVASFVFVYAVVSDGLGTRLRSRVYAELDQRTGELATWSRLSYYAGIAPFNGLTFDRDTAVYPLEPFPTSSSSARRTRHIDWRGGQHLYRGWLSSRTPTQLVTVYSGSTAARLDIRPNGDGTGIIAGNRLNTNISSLIVVDPQGRVFEGKDIAPNARVPLAGGGVSTEMKRRLTTAFQDGRLQPPLGLGGRPTSDPRFQRGYARGRTYWAGQEYADFTPAWHESLMERAIDGIQNNLLKDNPLVEPGHYLALVDEVPGAAYGLEPDEHQERFQILMGKW